MPKLAIYLPSLDGGGAERVTVILANVLAKRGHSIDLVVANGSGPYRRDVSASIRLVDLRKRRVATTMPALWAYLRRERPDALLAGLGHANLIAVVAWMLSGSASRLFVTEHNSILRGLDTRKGRFIKWLMQRLYPLANAVVCVSKGIECELHDVLGLPREKLLTIYNPVDIAGIRASAALRPDHPWFSAGQPPVLIGVGRLTEQKDFATLLSAFAEVRQRRPVRLVILGDGEERLRLSDQAARLGVSDDLLMPGFEENPYAWMSASQVYVMSSAWEGLPGVLLEALACGTPVVSTDCRTGPDEILESGKWGRLVPVGDSRALAKAIELTLESENSVDANRRIGTFSMQNAANKYEKLLFGKRYGRLRSVP